jgi:hypothetical protein
MEVAMSKSKTFFRTSVLVPLLTLGIAAPVVGSTTESTGDTDDKCMALAWGMYASCLTSTESGFMRALCDIAFELNSLSCRRS